MRSSYILPLCIAIGLASVVGALWLYVSMTNNAKPEPISETIEYRIFSEADTGSIVSDIASGSMIIIQLPRAQYGDPMSISDDDNKPIVFEREDIEENLAVSFVFDSEKPISIRISGKSEAQKDFILTLKTLVQ